MQRFWKFSFFSTFAGSQSRNFCIFGEFGHNLKFWTDICFIFCNTAVMKVLVKHKVRIIEKLCPILERRKMNIQHYIKMNKISFLVARPPLYPLSGGSKSMSVTKSISVNSQLHFVIFYLDPFPSMSHLKR